MSKRFLLLVMATLLSIFVVVGCGSDGKDGADVDSSTVSELQLLIEDLQSQLDILNESGSASEETIAELEIRIAELIAQLKEMTGTSSTASLRKDIVVSMMILLFSLTVRTLKLQCHLKMNRVMPSKATITLIPYIFSILIPMVTFREQGYNPQIPQQHFPMLFHSLRKVFIK
ncbi:MAG: hypothetical protein LRY51_07075 [Geovibrio sp.]|nr:hypothetical protein [Geovibrio sp.]